MRMALSRLYRVSLVLAVACVSLEAAADPAELRKTAHDYYQWRDTAYPVATSAQGDHRFDDRLTDYRMPAVLERREHVTELLLNDCRQALPKKVLATSMLKSTNTVGSVALL